MKQNNYNAITVQQAPFPGEPIAVAYSLHQKHFLGSHNYNNITGQQAPFLGDPLPLHTPFQQKSYPTFTIIMPSLSCKLLSWVIHCLCIFHFTKSTILAVTIKITSPANKLYFNPATYGISYFQRLIPFLGMAAQKALRAGIIVIRNKHMDHSVFCPAPDMLKTI